MTAGTLAAYFVTGVFGIVVAMFLVYMALHVVGRCMLPISNPRRKRLERRA
jgi:hypothetical protein